MNALVEHVAERMLGELEVTGPLPTLNDGLFFDLEASENWKRRVSYFLRRLVTPSVEDVEWVALPTQAAALYYVLRPLRLLLRYLSLQSQRMARQP